MVECASGPLVQEDPVGNFWRVERADGHGTTLLEFVDQNPEVLRIDIFLDGFAGL